MSSSPPRRRLSLQVLAFAAIAALTVSGCKKSMTDEHIDFEPTDTVQSQLLEFKQTDTRTSDGAAVKLHSFKIKEGMTVTFVVSGGTEKDAAHQSMRKGVLDVDAAVLSTKGEVLLQDSDSAGLGKARLIFTAPKTGHYRLQVRTKGPGLKMGDYTVVWRAGTHPDVTN